MTSHAVAMITEHTQGSKVHRNAVIQRDYEFPVDLFTLIITGNQLRRSNLMIVNGRWKVKRGRRLNLTDLIKSYQVRLRGHLLLSGIWKVICPFVLSLNNSTLHELYCMNNNICFNHWINNISCRYAWSPEVESLGLYPLPELLAQYLV